MPRIFDPPFILRNPHIQTTLTSLKIRKIITQLQARKLIANSTEHILDCGNGIKLLGAYSNQKNNFRGLVTLIHGWEGSIDSAYILSASAALFARGYNVFRLNLRDHGDSHHLNREFFNSTRITEVIEALKAIQQLFPHQRNYLTGFSLGGNFALRIGQKIPNELSITKIVAVCPLIDPLRSTRNLQDNHFFYHRYFVKKWKRSIRKKLNLHKGLVDQSRLLNLNSLTAMHDYFVPRHTPFLTTNDYFAGYKIEAKDFKKSSTQILIIAAEDDPITRKSDYKTFGQTDQLNIEWQRFGGHCGFLQDINLTSWVDRKLVHTFEQSD